MAKIEHGIKNFLLGLGTETFFYSSGFHMLVSKFSYM